MIIRFYKRGNDDSPEFIKDLDVKSVRVDGKDFYRTVEVNFQQVAREVLGTSDGIITDSGYHEIHSCYDFWSTFKVRDGVKPESRTHGICTTEITAKTYIPGETHIEWPGRRVMLDGEDTGIEIGVDCFDPGFFITSSRKGENLVGGKVTVYFDKITTKNFKHAVRSDARIFKGVKDIIKFLKDPKKKSAFEQMHKVCGTVFGFEPVSAMWEHEVKEDLREELENLFYEINNARDEEEPAPVVTSRRSFGSDAKSEAIFRMTLDFGLWDNVVADFVKHDKLYMSEGNGFIYDLNEEAEEAVRRTSEYGLPYHVVRMNSREFGDMYAVLFVSKWREDWEMDVYNPEYRNVFANVYNASMGIDEMGSIWVRPVNGGLQRTA